MIKNIVVLGAQWGDEGKGKIIDLLTPKVKYVVRYQGGHNAGHTIMVGQKKIVLHLIPSGILHGHVINVIASGVVVSPISLMREIEMLKISGVSIKHRVFISSSCPLVLSYHVAMDLAREKSIKFKNKIIGTTGCGIGPVYEDKAARRALRVSDLYNKKSFEKKLKDVLNYYNFQLIHYYHEQPVNYDMVLQEVMMTSDMLIDMVVDVPELLRNAKKKGDKVIFEGAQGSLLDIDHGTYPYVTSSYTVAGSASVGTGIGPCYIDYIFGIVKAYSTRVGLGPFPTELSNDIGEWLCIHGNEFGATTGRRRRTGWFDAVAVKYSVQINSLFSCCLTKLDVLDGLNEIKICVAYRTKGGKIIYNFPYIIEELEDLIPVYEILPGWMTSTKSVSKFNQLPVEAQRYVRRIEEIIKIPIDIVSIGAERSKTIMLRNPLNISIK